MSTPTLDQLEANRRKAAQKQTRLGKRSRNGYAFDVALSGQPGFLETTIAEQRRLQEKLVKPLSEPVQDALEENRERAAKKFAALGDPNAASR